MVESLVLDIGEVNPSTSSILGCFVYNYYNEVKPRLVVGTMSPVSLEEFYDYVKRVQSACQAAGQNISYERGDMERNLELAVSQSPKTKRIPLLSVQRSLAQTLDRHLAIFHLELRRDREYLRAAKNGELVLN